MAKNEAVGSDKSETRGMLMCSGDFTSWLGEVDASIVFTTYQAGRIFFLGRKQDGSLWGHERFIEQCQGLWCDDQSLWTSSLYSLWRFENVLKPGTLTAKGADRLFIPREARITGRIDMHDIAIGDVGGRMMPIFVNTLYGCLATISETASFKPLWQPKFLSALAPEDRCHLNGLAIKDNKPAYVTAISRSDVADGWRERRSDGGVVVDVESGEIVATGLSMPHSPRLHDLKLWLLNSGTGEFGKIDPETGAFEPVCFCPGYARGLAFHGNYAVVGLSQPRNNATFEGLALDERLQDKDAAARCGLIVIDLTTGDIVQWLRFERTITELYDVALISGARQVEVVGFKSNDIQKQITVEI